MLALRNRHMANAFHTVSPKYRVRRAMLKTIASIPIPPCRQLNSIERILLIRPDHLGDVLLTTPALYALRTARPRAELHMLVGGWSADLLSAFDDIDAILTLPFPGFSRSAKKNAPSPYVLALRTAAHIRRIGYSAVVIFRPDHWWGALVAYLAGIPVRIGYDLPDTAPFLTRKLDLRNQHAVMQSLRLVEHWTGPIRSESTVFRFNWHEQDRAYVDAYLSEWGITPDTPLICIHPGSGTWVKRWTEEGWAEVGTTLSEQTNAAVVFTGSDHERPLIQSIIEKTNARTCIMAGDTHVSQLAALYARAQVVLGPDSGPLHLAAAVGTPTVTLFGPADPVEFGPWGDPKRHAVLTTEIACRPCRVLDWGSDAPDFHPCVRDITIARVLEAARRAMTAKNPNPG